VRYWLGEHFAADEGTIVGGTGMVGALRMACPWAGRMIFDTFATYSWVYPGAPASWL